MARYFRLLEHRLIITEAPPRLLLARLRGEAEMVLAGTYHAQRDNNYSTKSQLRQSDKRAAIYVSLEKYQSMAKCSFGDIV